MSEQEIIDRLVVPALKRANAELPGFHVDHPGRGTLLFGSAGEMNDSLLLISFILLLEEQIEQATGRKFTISADDLYRERSFPFASVESLALYLSARLG